ncbi:MAG: M20/M25/M40 family metallo-hydrolase [Synergistaceae bacterium]|nr:M20/M25/M40 family metallo-hydrolase [Synergistaceae bacterium]
MKDYLAIANSGTVWMLCAITVVIAFLQAIAYMIMAKLAGDAAKRVLGEANVQTSRPAPNMAGEDFAYYLAEKPGAFMFLSSSNPAKNTNVPHHNPKFDVDEDVLCKGSAVSVAIVEDFLGC